MRTVTTRKPDTPTSHPGSKAGTHSHLTQRAMDEILRRPGAITRARAMAGQLDSGRPYVSPQVRERLPQRCLPPRARTGREPLREVKPLTVRDRNRKYAGQEAVDPAVLTPAQRRRIEHKANRAVKRARA